MAPAVEDAIRFALHVKAIREAQLAEARARLDWIRSLTWWDHERQIAEMMRAWDAVDECDRHVRDLAAIIRRLTG